MDPWEGAAVGQLVVEGQHAARGKGARVGRLIELLFHGAVVVHGGAQEVRAAWQGAGPLRIEGLWMA